MPSARASSRGAFLNCRFDVNGIQKALASRFCTKSARLFMRLAYSSPPAGRLKTLGRVGHYALLLLTQARNRETHHIPGLQEQRVRLDAEDHARRRAGADDVAGKERHVLAHVRDDLRAAED